MRGALVVAALGLTLGLQACAFAPQLGQVAVDHNRMVARSTDELTLLNIVRASHRFPLHFTAVTEVNGNVSLSAGAELGVDLDPVVDPGAALLTGGMSTNPNYRAAVLATEKFQRGIQAPLAPELIAYYLDEGWRDGLLMALAVERVEVAPPGGGAGFAVVNEAEADSDFARLLCTHDLVAVPGATSVPLARFDQLIDLDALAAPSTTPAERRSEIEALLRLVGNNQVRLTGDTLELAGSTNVVELRPRAASRCTGIAPDPRLANAVLRPHFRSTLGVIYFLGEYQRLRAIEGDQAAYRIPHCGEDCRAGERAPERRPLIAILEGGGEALLATEFERQRYFVPANELRDVRADQGELARTMQVLAFVEQLVNLQKSADQLPTSLTVTASN